ncbi:cleavage and polyadenylation specificity factor subunit 2 [Strongylocentrotus purpuratus]|uniref:Cleavage and polyadenylation specificity factor subunit 2 n=1 Tax=Strongylocentrotus purpuratus TaxID=7668 RepID=A0A7M7PPM3_STRPU|nr:cleavage and polyadenylation specificity factor subunit 2-like [Strongylocentrotus purpuratus]XP_030855156.1 cleavage and polyadenylation specificity factor subunit 2 [Strongylocentrotus purpuratus]|eukprot:XP_780045.3 PREDICTED: cleavage and polyadenylation specificity factor subunit 2 [Strongylocentrotus purpuratus]
MTSIIKLTPFSGVLDESPPCYMLQVDEFRFLLDCGWDEHFTMENIEGLKKHIHQVDAVLLSYPDNLHLGALPYLVGKCNLTCPIYATVPVYKMGQMFMYDLYQSKHNYEEFDLFNLDDVDAAFDRIIQLKYSQSVTLKGKGHGLTITPLSGGHMIGGTIWKIVKDGEEEIIYAVDYNHKKERHLNGAVLETISRPSLLITDCFNATYVQARRRARDEKLMDIILNTMRNEGNVLISVDTAGRVVELSLLLDQLWRNQDSGLGNYNLAMLNNVSYNVVEFAKSQVEWMSDKVMRAFEDRRNNPFQFKHLKLCHNLKELAKVPDPKVVLASVPDLECGYSRELFIQWSGDAKNSVILTNRTSHGTLARRLIETPNPNQLKLRVSKRVKLEKEELDEYRIHEKEKERQRKVDEAAQRRLEGDSSDESEEEMEVDDMGRSRTKHDLMMNTDTGKKGTSFFKTVKKSYPMFPFHEERLRWDDYGEVIKPEDYMIKETVQTEEEKEVKEEENADFEDAAEGDIPTKCIASQIIVDVKCSITFIDFEGRSDGESMKKLITQVKPRQLVLVRGQMNATQHLAEYCHLQLAGVKVFIPRMNEICDATMESHIYQVKLKDSLVSSLLFSKTRDTELSWIDGCLDLQSAGDKLAGKAIKGSDSSPNGDEKSFGDEKKKTPGLGLGNESEDSSDDEDDIIPVLDAVQTNEVTPHRQVYVNPPRFLDFKQVLAKNGIRAEFTGGVLVCNNTVAIKRNEKGHLTLEGAVCDDYYTVRELLYEQYAIV